MGSFATMFSRFLREVAVVTKDNTFDKAAEQFNRIENLRPEAATSFHHQFGAPAPAQGLETINPLLLSIADAEEQAWRSLATAQ